MRVLFVAPGGVNGGVEKKLLRLCRHFASRGFEPRVLLLRKTPALEIELTREDVPWQSGVLDTRRRAAGIATARARLGFELKDNPVGAVVAFGAPAMCVALPAAASSNPSAARIAAVVGQMDDPFREPQAPFEARPLHERLSFALSIAHAITVVSDHLIAEVDHFVSNPPPIEIIPNGVDIPQWRADVTVQPPTALCVANFLPIKGHDLLANALTYVSEPLTVTLCGEGPVRNQALELFGQLPSHITIQAPETPVDVQKYLAHSQFTLQPSRSEGQSHAVLESLAAGLPVVGFACAGNRTLVEHGRTGVLVPEGDRRALAMVIDQLAANPQVRSRLGQRARERAHDFPWSTTLTRYESLVRQLADTGSLGLR